MSDASIPPFLPCMIHDTLILFPFPIDWSLGLELLSKFSDIVMGSFAASTNEKRVKLALGKGFIDHLCELLLPGSLKFTSVCCFESPCAKRQKEDNR